LRIRTVKALDQFFAHCVGINGARESTARMYRHQLKKFFKLISVDEYLPDLSEGDIAGVLTAMQKRGMAMNTRRIMATALRQFYAWLSETYKQPNPAKNLKAIREYIKHPEVLRLDEVERMILTCGMDTFEQKRNAAIICVLADTGIRVSELCALKVRDVVMEEKQFVMTVPATKGNKTRYVPFCYLEEKAIVAEAFTAYYMDARFRRGLTSDDHLFQRTTIYYRKAPQGGYYEGASRNIDPGPMSHKSVWLMLKRIAEQAKVERAANPHSFRHFYGTYLALSGVPVTTIQMRMGHSSLERTQIYLHTADMIKGDSAKDSPLSKTKVKTSYGVKVLKMLLENDKEQKRKRKP